MHLIILMLLCALTCLPEIHTMNTMQGHHEGAHHGSAHHEAAQNGRDQAEASHRGRGQHEGNKMVTLKIKVTYQDNWSLSHPLANALVAVFDQRESVPLVEKLQLSPSGEQVVRTEIIGSDNYALLLRVSLENEEVQIVVNSQSPLQVYTFESEPFPLKARDKLNRLEMDFRIKKNTLPSSFATTSKGKSTKVETWKVNALFQMAASITYGAWIHLLRAVGFPKPKVTVVYPGDAIKFLCPNDPCDLVNFPATTLMRIEVSPATYASYNSFAHEYGHFIMFLAMNNRLPTVPPGNEGAHYACWYEAGLPKESDVFAWTEGYASAFSVILLNLMNVDYEGYYVFVPGIPREAVRFWGLGTSKIVVEKYDCAQNAFGGGAAQDEARILAALWDLYDKGDEVDNGGNLGLGRSTFGDTNSAHRVSAINVLISPIYNTEVVSTVDQYWRLLKNVWLTDAQKPLAIRSMCYNYINDVDCASV